MKTHYQHPIRLEEVAKTVGMTPAYLSHFISKNLGVSFQDYLTSLRFEHALRMIAGICRSAIFPAAAVFPI
jgi:YesN/AraC family two-component response regulator